MPVFAVVTNPPMLGLAMSHSEKGIEMSANTWISLPTRSAETGKDTDLVTPCISRSPTALYLVTTPATGIVPRPMGEVRVNVVVGYLLTSMIGPAKRALR